MIVSRYQSAILCRTAGFGQKLPLIYEYDIPETATRKNDSKHDQHGSVTYFPTNAANMKNLAIIIGVTDYADVQYSLPGCANDVAVMEMVLRSSGRFEVQTLESADGELIKNRLSETIKRYSDEEIDHLLFYFTGHGAYLNDDFHFLFRDYTGTRSAQTSLASKDLDSMLRSLQPKLAVKVIDACHSGLSYVKSGSTVQQELGEGMKATFANCHFLFSSEGDQKSYANRDMSDFTAAFAHSIVKAKTEDVRYRYIIDSVTDAFSNQDGQTPYFVSQGPLTEILGRFDDAAKARIVSLLPKSEVNEEDLIEEMPDSTPDVRLTETAQERVAISTDSLAELAKRAAANYVTQEQGTAVVQSIHDGLSQYIQSYELLEIYSPEKEFFDSYPELPNERSIGAWLERNKHGEYFAEPTYRTELYDAPPSLIGSSLDLMMPQFNMPTKKTRKVLTGVTSSLRGMPFQAFCLTLRPELLNLALYRFWLTFLISKTTIQVFHSFVEYKEVSWGKYEESELMTGWTRNAYSLTNSGEINELPKAVFRAFDAWVIDQVKKRLAVA